MLDADAPAQVPADRVRHYTLWLGGGRVGSATETEAWSSGGVTLRRDEDLRFARGDAIVALHTSIVVVADAALVPRRVTWSERGQAPRSGEATRDRAGWHASTGAVLPDDAIPAELAPLRVRRDGRFAGPVFLPARGFVAGAGTIAPVAAGRSPLMAKLALADGTTVLATIELADDRMPGRIVDGDGVIAMRATAAEAGAPFPAVDLVAATAIPIEGVRAAPRLVLDVDAPLPPVPGQLAHPAAAGGVEVVLDPELPGALAPEVAGADHTPDIGVIVDDVRARIAPDLGAGPSSAADADAATAGDCTTFALAYASVASRAGIATRIVTGLRVDGARLVRHRWAVSWTGRAWIAVDAAYGTVKAGGDLVGVAVTDADDAGLVAGEAALARVRNARWVP